MFEDLNILDYISDVTFTNVDEKHVVYREKRFSESFGCCSLYICSASSNYNVQEVNCEAEEDINNCEVKTKNKKIVFVLKVYFVSHEKFVDFKDIFKKYYVSSKDSFLFWLNVKSEYNNALAKRKVAEINELNDEVNDINHYINNKS